MPDPALPWVSVWPTGQADLPAQLTAGGYLPATAADTGGLPPALAAHAVHAYTEPGDVVLDPDCGAGTVLVEAVRAGRHAAGVTGRRWWPTARGNLTAAKLAGAPADGMVLDPGPGRTRPGPLRPGRLTAVPAGTAGTSSGAGAVTGPAGLGGLAGRVDLILTAVRPHLQVGRPGADTEDRLAGLFAGCGPLLRPGGHAVVVAGAVRRSGRLVDLPGVLVRAARRAGLVPVDRCVALTTPTPVPQPPVPQPPDQRLPGQRLPGHPPNAGRRGEHTGAHPVARPAHLDVYVFARPSAEAAEGAALPAPSAPVAAAVPAGPAGPVQLFGEPPAGVRPAGRWAA